MKNDAATVALGAEKAFELVFDTELGGEQRFGDGADGAGADFDGELPGFAELDGFGFVAEADIERRQAGRRVPQRRSLDDLRRQRDPIGQAEASWGARRDSSRSTAFIMTEGVVSA